MGKREVHEQFMNSSRNVNSSKIVLDRKGTYNRIIIYTVFDITTLRVADWSVHFNTVVIRQINMIMADANMVA